MATPTLKPEQDSRQILWLQTAVVFLFALLLGCVVVNDSEQRRLDWERMKAHELMEVHANTIEQSIRYSLTATYALAAVVRQGNGKVSDFQGVAAAMFPFYPGISALQLAPAGVIREIAPLTGNEAALGLDLLKDPAQTREAFLARETGLLALAGPFELVQGGLGLAGRQPVFLGAGRARHFWGFTTVLIPFSEILNLSGLSRMESQGYHYVLWHTQPDSGQRQIIAASPGKNELIDPVVIPISIPNGDWMLSAAPVEGWHSPLYFAKSAFAAVVAAFLALSVYLLLRQPGLLRQKVAEQTRELKEREEVLNNLNELSSDWAWEQDAEFRFTSFSPGMARILGTDPAVLIGRCRWNSHNTLAPEAWEVHRRCLEAHEVFRDFEYGIHFPDGTICYINSSGQPLFDADGTFKGYRGTSKNITARKQAELKYDRQVKYNEIMRDMALKFINLPIYKVFAATNEALEQVGNFFGVERAYVLDYDFADGNARISAEWCAEGVEPQIENAQPLPIDSIPDWVEPHRRGGALRVECVESLPAGSLRDLLQSQHVRSHLSVPLMRGNDCLGFVAMDALSNPITFGQEEAALLSLFAQQLLNLMERQSKERAIAEREVRFQSLFENAPVALSVTTAKDAFNATRWNHTWLVAFGYPADMVQGKSGNDFGFWADPAMRTYYINSAIKLGGVSDVETRMRHHDGRIRLVNVSGRFIVAAGTRMLITVYQDVTEVRANEQAIRDLNVTLESRIRSRTQELSAANEVLSQTIENLRVAQKDLVHAEKLASLGALVAGVAHELGTPIGNCLTVASSLGQQASEFAAKAKSGLRRSDLDGFVQTSLQATELLMKSMQRANQLVAGFKQVAVDQSSEQRRSFDLATTVGEVTAMLQPTLRKMPWQLSLDIPAGITLDSDPGPLDQVIANLINNAAAHAFEGREQGSIGITAHVEGSLVIIEVADDGIGMSSAIRARAFDPFFTTKLGKGGSGLGMHLVFNIVTGILGGSIELNTAPGAGCRVILRIPLVAPDRKVADAADNKLSE